MPLSDNFNKSLMRLFLFFFLAGCLVSCTSENRLEGYIYYRLNAAPSTLDPALIVDVTGGAISAKLFNGLVRLEDGMKIIPDIAETWRISEDGLVYEFKIRKGVKFSNNQTVTASDFKYSFKRILDPKTRSPNTWIFEKIAGAIEFMEGKSEDIYGIKVIDEQTISLRLEKPFAPFLYLLTMPAAYVVAEKEARRLGPDFSTQPVGTGPFILREWLPNRELRLERNKDYFGAKANIKGLVYRIITEDLTAMVEFELGNLDLITIPASETARYRGDPKRNKFIEAVAGINTYYLGMNCSRPPFSNIKLRKAVSLAIDRKKLLDTFYEKRGRLASGPVPDILRKWDSPVVVEYDPEKSRALIKHEGLSGSSINLFVTADQEVVDMAEFIQAYLKTVGLKVKITQLEWSAYKEAVNKGEADMFWLSWWADYPDPENFLFPLFHSANTGPSGNRARYSNTKVDRLIEQGAATLNENLRALYYEKAERQIVEDSPWVFFWHKTDYLVRQPRLKNYRAYPIYTMDKGTEISLEQ